MTVTPPEVFVDYKEVNRSAWTRLAVQGNTASHPFDKQQLAEARYWLDPEGWIDWTRVRNVLCVASGGGQQAVLCASLGCVVASADLCPEQLAMDLETARRLGLDIECVEADMLNLSALHGRNFDLVYQAISACYVPDVRRLYGEISLVLRPGGHYRVDHWNPIHMQLGDAPLFTGRGYELIRPCVSGSRHVWRSDGGSEAGVTECWHYLHSLTDLIGSLCDSGFRVSRFAERTGDFVNAEPGSDAHVGSFVPPVLSLYAEKAKGDR
jgi:SAM-dependent methyltransferase